MIIMLGLTFMGHSLDQEIKLDQGFYRVINQTMLVRCLHNFVG